MPFSSLIPSLIAFACSRNLSGRRSGESLARLEKSQGVIYKRNRLLYDSGTTSTKSYIEKVSMACLYRVTTGFSWEKGLNYLGYLECVAISGVVTLYSVDKTNIKPLSSILTYLTITRVSLQV